MRTKYRDTDPDSPPGYVFWSHHEDSYDPRTKKNMTTESVQAHVAEIDFQIPKDAVLVLENVVPHARFSSFVKDEYSNLIWKAKDEIMEFKDLLKKFVDGLLQKREDADVSNSNRDEQTRH